MFLLRWMRDWPALDVRAVEHSSDRVQGIVRRHLDAVCRTARRLGVPAHELDDVVQDVMLVVVRRMDDIEAGKERAFAVGTCVRVVANWRRRVRSRPEPIDERLEALAARDLDPALRFGAAPADELADRGRQLALLERALRQMTEAQREAFVAFELEELTAKQVADTFGVSEGTIVSRVRRAREVLWRVCAEAGHPAGAGPGRHEGERDE
jgi:RNA polymerase sigma-70 factor (ECF subfamily)